MNFFSKIFFIFLAGIFSIEMISWLSWSNIDLNKIFFIAIIIGAFILSLIKLEWGIYIVLAELFIGSKGYLLSYPFGSFSISLRLGLFLAIFLAYIIWVIRDRKIKFFQSKLWPYYTAFLFFMAVALLIGYLRHNELKNIFYDWNGYLYFGLLFPIMQCINNKQKIYNILQVLWAAITALIIKTLLLLFIFSQTNYFGILVLALYKWVRDTGVGEITKQPNGFYRIFMQSQIYLIIIFFIGLSILTLLNFREIRKKNWWLIFILTSLSLLTIFLSYSRSFWLGSLCILFVFFLALIFVFKIKFKKIIIIVIILLAVFSMDYGLILGIINLPLPGNSAISAGSLISERTQDPTQEAAGSSRMELLKPLLNKNIEHAILGSGFGTTVTYKTKDPRALEQNPSGNYTTYAFEWGYLDLWLKLGIIGSAAYLLLIWKIFQAGYKKITINNNIQDKTIIFGSLLGFLAILVIHFFTPYLNHPLGIGWILIVSQLFDEKI
jgi:hypothetical protein